MTVAAQVGADLLARLDGLAAERGMRLLRDVPLAPLTTLRVGGPADRLIAPESRPELLAAIELARAAGIAPFMLGKGSDLVVADGGIRGLVIRNRADGIEDAGTTLVVDSGTPMARLVRHATSRGLTGLEFGISIPGTLGGAVWANAGAHGGEMRDVLRTVEVIDQRTGSPTTLDGAACGFGYRESRFKHGAELVLAAALELRPGDPVTIGAEVDAHQARRQATQPLADQNAGSVFRNPPGDHAGRLVDAAGLKGRQVGSAMVSPLHANFIVTDRGGSAADVRALGDLVRAEVAARFGITLAYEIEFVGDWADAEGDAPAGTGGGG